MNHSASMPITLNLMLCVGYWFLLWLLYWWDYDDFLYFRIYLYNPRSNKYDLFILNTTKNQIDCLSHKLYNLFPKALCLWDIIPVMLYFFHVLNLLLAWLTLSWFYESLLTFSNIFIGLWKTRFAQGQQHKFTVSKNYSLKYFY